jgi:drug/metabolite transporter (DMT)-like permease
LLLVWFVVVVDSPEIRHSAPKIKHQRHKLALTFIFPIRASLSPLLHVYMTAIIIGGSVLFGTVLGYVALHEMLTYRGWIGVGLIAAGISLVGIDPGGAGGIHG